MDRRKDPRIKFVKIKPEYSVIIEFNDKAVLCKLVNLSDGGAQVLVNDQNREKITEDDIGKNIIFKCSSTRPQTDISKDAKIVRYEEDEAKIMLGISFKQ